MKMNALKFAFAAIAAAFCMSAMAPAADCKEIAMAKCTKDSGSCDANGDCEDSQGGCSSGCSSGGCQGDQSDASAQVKTQRKSAAQKVVEGN